MGLFKKNKKDDYDETLLIDEEIIKMTPLDATRPKPNVLTADEIEGKEEKHFETPSENPLEALRRKMMATCHLSSAKDKLQETAGDRLTSNLYKMFSGMKQQPSHVKKTALNERKLSTVLSTQW